MPSQGPAHLHWQAAQKNWAEGRLEQAEQHLQKLLTYRPDSPPALALLGEIAQARHAWKIARTYYEKAHERDPGHPHYVHLLAEWFTLRNAPEQAEKILADFLSKNQQYPDLWVEYAAILGNQGKLEEAKSKLEDCLKLYASQLDAWLLLGNLNLELGQFEASEKCYQEILARQPALPETQRRLGLLYLHLGQYAKAQAGFEKALELNRNDAETWNNLGTCLLMASQTPQDTAIAIRAFLQGLARDSRNAHIMNNIGLGFYQLKFYPESLFYFDQARIIDPQLHQGDFEIGLYLARTGKADFAREYLKNSIQYCDEPQENQAEAHTWLGYMYAQKGELVQAAQHYRKAEALCPGRGGNWLAQSLLPAVLTSEAEGEQIAQAYRQSISDLLAKDLTPLGQLPLEMPGQYWAYLGFQGREEQELQAQLWGKFLSQFRQNNPGKLRPHPPWRIALVSRYFHNHAVMGVFSGLISSLAAEPDFELHLFSVGPIGEDSMRRHLKNLNLKWHGLEGKDISEIQTAIMDHAVDLLMYPELGMDPLSFALANSRLAPWQVVLAGHPITTGLSTIDAFISSQWLEPPDAESHYSESLVCLEELLPDFPFPELPAELKSKADLGLDPQKHTYLCPMTLFKIHPAMDAAFAGILQADPQAEILLYKFPEGSLHAGLEQKLQQRFFETIPEAERIRFLTWAKKQDLLQQMAQAEVVLDSFPFGGGNTSYLTLATGTPLVTLVNPYMRGRSSTALYRRMGLDTVPAEQVSEYVQKAVLWATDPAERDKLQAEILARRDVLFNNSAGSQALIRYLKSILQTQLESN
ncbi:hypothetical protein COW36_02025 [bacterium (Candidatus Blackallbacteria) CG17_big_fil_post_rev_8_21_14_2_50_48_46]|uniref:protein O-GlcNAc transferase n=1 Tax=bacterium (Candidatus Blackallbacteria) CG17_big_fil_post_rev_8_21_14_2_50_48_46 TaxID=2014261 RepID=A0A2M7GAN0_9BACT|nr:MAG: hypothetical protein COW64_26415 [bacterium (Candidatus Blackallbacteria) CG18_big_fil_WC_8_21_14_2_50_49_26]PIW19212.1 MAG: hypothetical protein COW36_02025 [bacterium (Candidatus Blackallbacteria) CG17_big_fil_post_rev_8_21_14_2_50_48_46]PIW45438.1 MAG: hypothetical protein COW20_20115 [bacterium (Candidatus Blackallbacteria) CG13_big_fil_rev_8_21_14_2_50_49_14]